MKDGVITVFSQSNHSFGENDVLGLRLAIVGSDIAELCYVVRRVSLYRVRRYSTVASIGFLVPITIESTHGSELDHINKQQIGDIDQRRGKAQSLRFIRHLFSVVRPDSKEGVYASPGLECS